MFKNECVVVRVDSVMPEQEEKEKVVVNMNLEEEFKPTFGERIRELLEENNFTQTRLARDLNVKSVTVNRWVQNIQRPDFDRMCELADYFDVSLGYLIGQTDERTVTEPDDEFYAKCYEEEEQHFMINRTIQIYKDLSDEMQLMIQNAILNAYDIDSKRGALKSQQSNDKE